MFEDTDDLDHGPSGDRIRYFILAALLAMIGYALFQQGRYWWWKSKIDQVDLGMSAGEVIERLGPLPPKDTVEDNPGQPSDRTTFPDIRYCVTYFFFNGGPGVNLCFDSANIVVHKEAYQWSLIDV